jgi:hypothetical protein
MLVGTKIQIIASGSENITTGADQFLYGTGLSFSVGFTDDTGVPGTIAFGANINFHYVNSNVPATTGVTLALNAITGSQHPGGDTLDFTNIKGIAIANHGAVPLLIFGAASNSFQGPMPAASQLTLPAGCAFAISNSTAAGWATASAYELLIAGSGGVGSVELFLVGDGTLS